MSDQGNAFKGLILFGCTGFFLWLCAVAFMKMRDRSGVAVVEKSCEWNSNAQIYEAGFTLSNNHDSYKVIELIAQARFKPSRNTSWPSRKMRNRFEAQNQHIVILLPPLGQEDSEILSYDLGGLENYICELEITIAGQENYSEAPTYDLTY